MQERGNQSPIRRFLSDFGLYSIAAFVPALLGIVALFIFTHTFSTDAYGRYSLTIVIIAVLSTLVFGWLEQSVLRFQTEINRQELAANLVSLLSIITFGGLGIGAVGYVLFRGELNEYRSFYIAGVLLLIGQGLFNVLRALSQARLESADVTRYKLLRAVLKLVFALVFAIVVLDDIVGWVWGSVVGTVLVVVIMGWRANVFDVTPRFGKTMCLRMAKYGFPMIGWLVGVQLLNFGDRVLLEFLQGSSAVGIYSSNYALAHRGVPLVLGPIIQAAHPLIMDTWNGDNADEVTRILTKFTRYFFLIGIPATAGVAILSQPISDLLLGAEYQSGYVIIPVVAVGLFLWNLGMLAHKGLEVQERTTTMLIGVVLTVGLNLLLNVPLIQLYGYFGAGVATMVSSGFYLVFAMVMSGDEVPWNVPQTTLRNAIIGGCVMVAPAASLYLSGGELLVQKIIAAILGCGLYVIVLYLADEFKEQELTMVRSFVPKIYD